MVRLQCVRVGMFQTNCYIVYDEEKKEGIIVDPGDNGDYLKGCIEGLEITPAAILLTHAHLDPIGAVEDLKSAYNIPFYVGEADVAMLKDPRLNMGGFSIELGEGDRALKDGEILSLAGMEIEVIATPGHTPGGVSFYFKNEGFLLSGDTLFRYSWGRTDFPGGSERQLMQSIREKLLPLPAETLVYPGHEGATTIKAERAVHDYTEEN